MAIQFESSLFIEVVKNAKENGYLIQKENGEVVPLTQGAKGIVIQPSQVIKEMLFGDSSEADELTKSLIIGLGGRLKSGPTGGKRGRKPKVAKA